MCFAIRSVPDTDQRRDTLSVARRRSRGRGARGFRHETPGSQGGSEVFEALDETFLKRSMKRYGRPRKIVTDRLRSYRSPMKVIGIASDQICGRWLNNRAENSHQPFRRREGAMAKFRDIKTLQKFASVHASIHNHFNHDRHLNRRDIFKQNRAAALAEWCQLAA